MQNKISFGIFVWKENTDYIALCLQNFVSSFGSTAEEAIDQLQEALELYYEDIPIDISVSDMTIANTECVYA